MSEATNVIDRTIELLQERKRIDAELAALLPQISLGPSAPVPQAPPQLPALPAAEASPSRRRRPRGAAAPRSIEAKPGKAPRGGYLVSDDFPGNTHAQVRELCGVGKDCPLSSYVNNGGRIGRKHIFKRAPAGAVPSSNGDDSEPAPARKSILAIKAETTVGSAGDARWKCAACSKVVITDAKGLPPASCSGCGKSRFNRVWQ